MRSASAKPQDGAGVKPASLVGRRLVLAAGGLLVALAAGEAFFRIVPFERVKYEVRYGHFSGNLVGDFLEYDPVLTFRNRRGASFPEAGVEINSLGLRGPEVTIAKPPGVLRVLCLGDSCTFGGPHPYPDMLQAILDRRAPGRFQVLNAGVIGYTSVHGLAWLESELEALQPAVVTIYYGWNDMWREKDSAVRDWFRSRVERRPPPLVRSRLFETLSRSFVFLENSFGLSDLQVPPEKYRAALATFARIGRERGFTPLYVTAPAGFRDDETPHWLVEQGFVAHGDSAPRLRREYNRVVADVARAEKLPLADCAADFERSGGRALFANPEEDPIHPNDAGYRRIAERLAEEILALNSADRSNGASASRGTREIPP